ncbi:hypothetical protein [Opitutus sp. ER46]|uniref:hypothetical protein n=1 Tax=Opitutus sp. ER46 TaxID=2161864 RepID=UPI000D3230D1|nr:hypothetical protein [Opitutus sp. ER46]PTY00124.1 hypothetical protein DB354_02215 [Opitutus sp. ER46]
MNPNQEPTDRELDRLLGSQLNRTSPAFEQRWRELRGDLVGRTGPRRPNWTRWLWWPGLATAGLAAVALFLVTRSPAPAIAPADAARFEELIALDAALAPARPLLDTENRDALIQISIVPDSVVP